MRTREEADLLDRLYLQPDLLLPYVEKFVHNLQRQQTQQPELNSGRINAIKNSHRHEYRAWKRLINARENVISARNLVADTYREYIQNRSPEEIFNLPLYEKMYEACKTLQTYLNKYDMANQKYHESMEQWHQAVSSSWIDQAIRFVQQYITCTVIANIVALSILAYAFYVSAASCAKVYVVNQQIAHQTKECEKLHIANRALSEQISEETRKCALLSLTREHLSSAIAESKSELKKHKDVIAYLSDRLTRSFRQIGDQNALIEKYNMQISDYSKKLSNIEQSVCIGLPNTIQPQPELKPAHLNLDIMWFTVEILDIYGERISKFRKIIPATSWKEAESEALKYENECFKTDPNVGNYELSRRA